LTFGWGFGWMTVFDRLVEMIPANVYLPKDNPTDQWVRFSIQFFIFKMYIFYKFVFLLLYSLSSVCCNNSSIFAGACYPLVE
jgi:hypothetical protein